MEKPQVSGSWSCRHLEFVFQDSRLLFVTRLLECLKLSREGNLRR
jgi:hypothetical protein